MSIQLDFGAVLAQWPLLLQGITWTAGLTAVSTVAGLGLGIAAGWARNEGPLPLRWTVGLYVELIRNTPFIIQLFFVFFGLPALGLPGSGLATALSSVLMFAGLAALVLRDRQFRRFRLFGRFWVADWPRYRAFWRLGLPIGATLAFEVVIFNGAAFLMGLIGPTALAAHAIAIQIASLTFMVPMGIGQAATVRVGRAFGAGDRDGIRRAGQVAIVLGVGFMALTALVMWLAPHWLVRPFLDVSRPGAIEVAALAMHFLVFAAIFQIVDGAQVVGSCLLRGLGDTRIPMLYAGLGYWVIGLPLSVALGFGTPLAGSGIWIGLAVALALVAALMLGRWAARERLGLMPAAPYPGT